MEPETHPTAVAAADASPVLCANNCGFFGSPATHNLCSKCYKATFLAKSKAAVESVVAAVESVVAAVAEAGSAAKVDEGDGGSSEKPAAKKNRCSSCNKRVGLMGFKCRCGELFCPVHRYSDKHGCPFDYKGEGQDAIAKANPIVKPHKVEKI